MSHNIKSAFEIAQEEYSSDVSDMLIRKYAENLRDKDRELETAQRRVARLEGEFDDAHKQIQEANEKYDTLRSLMELRDDQSIEDGIDELVRENAEFQNRIEGASEAWEDANEMTAILLQARGCLTDDGRIEIPEELSAHFDIGLDKAQWIVNHFVPVRTPQQSAGYMGDVNGAGCDPDVP